MKQLKLPIKRESQVAPHPVIPIDEHQLLNQMVLAFDWLERMALKGDGKLTFDFGRPLVPEKDSLFLLVIERIIEQAKKEQSHASETDK